MLGEASLEKLRLPIPLNTKLLEWGWNSERRVPLSSPPAPEPGSEILPGGRRRSKQRALNVFPKELISFATECGEVPV